MKIFYNSKPDFLENLKLFLQSRFQDHNEKIDLEVQNIINEVRKKGDEALF